MLTGFIVLIIPWKIPYPFSYYVPLPHLVYTGKGRKARALSYFALYILLALTMGPSIQLDLSEHLLTVWVNVLACIKKYRSHIEVTKEESVPEEKLFYPPHLNYILLNLDLQSHLNVILMPKVIVPIHYVFHQGNACQPNHPKVTYSSYRATYLFASYKNVSFQGCVKCRCSGDGF